LKLVDDWPVLNPANHRKTKESAQGGEKMYQTTKYVSGAVAPKRGYESHRPDLKVHQKEVLVQTKKISLPWIVTVIAVVLLVGLVMYRYNSMLQLDYKLTDEKKQYYAMVDQNTQMKVFIEKNLDLNHIKSKAIYELNMQKPGANQKVPVSVPVQDLSVATPAAESTPDSSIFSFFANTLKAVFG